MYVKLITNKKPKAMRLHKLIALMFIPNPQNKPFIHHIDCNTKNNHADNLMWVTQAEHLSIHRNMKGGECNE